MNWVLLAILSAFFFGAYNVFIKAASGHINQILGAVILQIVAALVGGIILLVIKMTHGSFEISQKGVWFAVFAGITVGLAEITSFYMFSKGVPASTGIPIIVGGSILVGALLGLLFLKETINPIHYIAILLIIAGVVLLTTR